MPLPPCRAGSGLSLRQPIAEVPPFYLYQPPFDPRALKECFERNKHKQWNASTDASAWIYHALEQHTARVRIAERAEVLLYVTFSRLSEAAGLCNGQSHYRRMVAAANALKAQNSFSAHPADHLLINGVDSTTRAPLGELGQLVSAHGGRAACLDPKLCGFFRADRALSLPWPTCLGLQTDSIRTLVDDEACGTRRQPNSLYGARSIQLFFRGGFGTTKSAQDLRVRIPLLRRVAGAHIGIVGSERLLPSAQAYASKSGMSRINRLKRMDPSKYASMMLRARYCLAPFGDVPSPGARLFDAIAAGCIPILVGIDINSLPLSKQIDYKKFVGTISKNGFSKDAVYAVESLIHKLDACCYGPMTRALADARARLIYGVGDEGPAPTGGNATVAFGDAAGMLLREFWLTK